MIQQRIKKLKKEIEKKNEYIKLHKQQQEQKIKKVPLTIISGFLGSGKTTLLKNILHQSKYKIAVIENEFGDEIGIERLIAKDSGSNDNGEDDVVLDDLFIELSSGCICCAVKDDLVTTIEQLLVKKKDKFDYIVIETSGMADPGTLASMFWLDDELESQIKLDSIITVVDSFNLVKKIDLKQNVKELNEIFVQLVHADKMILNKVDLLNNKQEDLLKLENVLQEINPLCSKDYSTFCNVEIETLLNIKAFNPIEASNKLESLYANNNLETEHKKHHTHEISSIAIQVKQPIDLVKFKQFLGELLWEMEEMEIFRMKGLLQISNSNNVYILQAVNEIFELEASNTKKIENGISKIVIIGKHLDKPLIEKLILQCCCT